MQLIPTAIEGLWLIRPVRHGDARGFLAETFHAERFAAAGLPHGFVMDAQSLTQARGTLRGLHLQLPPHAQTKLVRVGRGAVLDVAVDLRPGSASFGRHVALELTAEGGEQLLIPKGFAHGFLTLADDTEILYKMDAYHAPSHERGIAWNDPELEIAWPIVPGEEPRLSPRDRYLPPLADLLPELGRPAPEG